MSIRKKPKTTGRENTRTMNRESVRVRGGSATENIRARLVAEAASPDQRILKAEILHDVAELVQTVLEQALSGDEACGYFLGELIPLLSRREKLLRKANSKYRERSSRVGSARLATRKNSPIRSEIEPLLANARRQRRWLQIVSRTPGLSCLADFGDEDNLCQLPELDSSDAAIDEWTEKFVYPRFQKYKDSLKADPRFSKMKKAGDENTKFQVSRLKSLIRDTVARVAAIPKTYYFDLYLP